MFLNGIVFLGKNKLIESDGLALHCTATIGLYLKKSVSRLIPDAVIFRGLLKKLLLGNVQMISSKYRLIDYPYSGSRLSKLLLERGFKSVPHLIGACSIHAREPL